MQRFMDLKVIECHFSSVMPMLIVGKCHWILNLQMWQPLTLFMMWYLRQVQYLASKLFVEVLVLSCELVQTL